ncbi:MAG TPA: MMPL family transporter, partial [Humibacillus xanthopallidus]|nr:MMPL family transporter [Humibacillus xanthopallidus]
MARLGRLIARHPGRWVIAWILITAACFAVAVGGVTGESLFNRLHSGAPTVDSESTQARQVIEQSQPALETLTMQVTGANLSDTTVVADGTAATKKVGEVAGVKQVRSPLLVPGGLTDPAAAPLLKGGTPAAGGFVTVVDFEPGLDKAAQDAAEAAAEKALLEVPKVMKAQGSVGSPNKIITAITTTVERDLIRGEGIALPLTFIVMFFVFAGFIAAGMPIIGAFVSIGGALLSLFAFSHLVELDATVVNIVTLLGLGLSIDYGLLTVSRFREELSSREHRVPSREEV